MFVTKMTKKWCTIFREIYLENYINWILVIPDVVFRDRYSWILLRGFSLPGKKGCLWVKRATKLAMGLTGSQALGIMRRSVHCFLTLSSSNSVDSQSLQSLRNDRLKILGIRGKRVSNYNLSLLLLSSKEN